MANVSLKTDFKDGEKLFGQQLNNNFAVIQAALATMNKITWQDDPDDSVVTFRGTTEEINQREIIDGQLLYDTTTGETYIDYGSQRISTGSGNAIYIGTGTPTNPSTQLWINPEESILPINTEVVNSMEGTEANKAPSVASVKNYINDKVQNVYSTDETVIGKWIDNKIIYRKVVSGTFTSSNIRASADLIENVDTLINAEGVWSPNSTTPNVCYGSVETSAAGGIDAYFQIRKNKSTNVVQLLEYSTTYSGSTGSYVLALEYTKTTD